MRRLLLTASLAAVLVGCESSSDRRYSRDDHRHDQPVHGEDTELRHNRDHRYSDDYRRDRTAGERYQRDTYRNDGKYDGKYKDKDHKMDRRDDGWDRNRDSTDWNRDRNPDQSSTQWRSPGTGTSYMQDDPYMRDDAALDTTPRSDTNRRTAGAIAQSRWTETEPFLREALEAGHCEVALGQLAAEKATTQAVRSFAQQMVQDHSNANQKLNSVAQSVGVEAVSGPGENGQSKIDFMRARAGVDFDRMYADLMVDSHRKAVAMFEAQASSGSNSSAREVAQELLPTLRQHLQHAEQMQAELRAGRTDIGDRDLQPVPDRDTGR